MERTYLWRDTAHQGKDSLGEKQAVTVGFEGAFAWKVLEQQGHRVTASMVYMEVMMH